VLILSASVGDADIEAALHAGANEFMPKPFSPADVLYRLASMRNGH
jgi:CheY-like chemotaxis protein